MEWCGCWVVLAELSSWWVGEKTSAIRMTLQFVVGCLLRMLSGWLSLIVGTLLVGSLCGR